MRKNGVSLILAFSVFITGQVEWWPFEWMFLVGEAEVREKWPPDGPRIREGSDFPPFPLRAIFFSSQRVKSRVSGLHPCPLSPFSRGAGQGMSAVPQNSSVEI